MSLRTPFTYLELPTRDEAFYNEAFSLVEKEIDALLKQADLLASIGKRDEALCLHKTITFYYVIIDYIYYKHKWLRRKGYECNEEAAESKFKISCVRESIVCLGREYNINFLKILNALDILCENPPPGEFANNEFRKPGFVE